MDEKQDIVLCAVRDNIAQVTINRPQALNALNEAVLTELERVMLEAEANPDVRVVILTGAGEKAFVAGADIAAMKDMSPLQSAAFSALGQRVFGVIENLGKIVIAAVNGFALGGGCELALACDIRVASEKARLGIPEVTLGVFPGFGGTQRLPRLVGTGVAKEMLATAKQVKADEALRIGLINHVAPPEELMNFCVEMAHAVAKNSVSAIALGKKAMNADLNKALAYEAAFFAVYFAIPDQKGRHGCLFEQT